MLRKAINISLSPCRTLPNKLFKNKLGYTNWHLKSNGIPSNLNRLPLWNFSTSKESVENIQVNPVPTNEPTQPEASKEEVKKPEQEEEEIIRENFMEFMQKEPNPEDIIYEYNRKVIFELKSQQKMYQTKKRVNRAMTIFWSAASYLTYSFLNPWLAIIPGVLTIGSLMVIRNTAGYGWSLVEKIYLIDPHNVKIFPLAHKGEDIICRIDDIELLGIQAVPRPPGKEEKEELKSYMIRANFRDAINNVNYQGMSIMIDPEFSTIENIDLLKCILYAKPKEVAKFRFLKDAESENEVKEETTQKSEIDEDDEFAEYKVKLEDNIDKRNKEVNNPKNE